MIDKAIGAFSILVLIGFLSIIGIYVPHIDLLVVLVVVCAMAIYDFYLSNFRNGGTE